MSNTQVRPGGVINNGFGGEPEAIIAAVDSFVAVIPPLSAALHVGQPMYALADGTGLQPAKANASTTATVLGFISKLGTGDKGPRVQFSGILTLTTAEWDARTASSGGLEPGVQYYLSAGTAGSITNAAPAGAGSFVVPIGSAISPTEMLIVIGAAVGPHA
jgi:hypothetical protein